MENKEILKGLKKTPYDFVANNYYKMDKEQLKDIILELICIADDLDDTWDGDDYRDKLVNNLIEWKSWDEE